MLSDKKLLSVIHRPHIILSFSFLFLVIGFLVGLSINVIIHDFARSSSDPLPAFAQTATANAILYGRTGSFGELGSMTKLPSGQSLQTIGISNWGFMPGQSEFFSALAPNGEVVLATTPQTDNQYYATGDSMNIGVFNPTQNTYRNIIVPTTKGLTKAANPFSPVGGASIETLLPVTVGGQSRLAFISLVNYHGWDIDQVGEYPALGYLDLTTGSLQYNSTLSKTAGQIYAKGGLSASACPTHINIFNQQVAGCRGLAEMGLLPRSQKFVITQYFNYPAQNEHSGRIIVMNTDGTVAASYSYPNIPDGKGGYLSINPREVVVDPTATGSLEYFSVIFDVPGTVFPLQEFAYNRTTNKIIPISAPILSGQKLSNGTPYRFETALYDSLGNLWVTQADPNSLLGGPIVVYSKTSGYRKLENNVSCKVDASWAGAGWGKTCAPDRTVADTGDYGQTRSFIQDPTSKTVFAATLNGNLLRVKQSGSGSSLTLKALTPLTIGLDKLVDRNSKYVGIRKGVVDVKKRILWVPVVQVATPQDCPTWPGSTPCTPKIMDQWLYRFNLNVISS